MAFEVITLNLIPSGDVPVIHAAQYDKNRPLIFALKVGEDDFNPAGYSLQLQVRKVDNNIVTVSPSDVTNNVVTFLTTEQMTACSGTNLCEIQIIKGDFDIATLHCYLVVQRDVLYGGLTSESDIDNLEQQITALLPQVLGDEYYTADEVDEKIAEIPTFDPTNYYTKTEVDDIIDDIPTFDPTNYYDKSQLYTKTETDNLLSAKADTSSLSTVATTGDYDDLLNKPTIPAAQVQSDWSQSDNTKVDYIKNKPSLSTVATSGDYDDLLNKPTIPAAQVQSDWSQSDNTKVDYIKNKPSLAIVATSGSYNDLLNLPTLPDMSNYYTTSETDDLLDDKADISSLPDMSLYYNKTQVDAKFARSDIKSQVTFDENISGTNTQVYAKAGVVYIAYQGENKTHNASDQLFTMPASYRPTTMTYTTYNINDVAFGEIGIGTDGKCFINHISTANASGRVYFTISYPLV